SLPCRLVDQEIVEFLSTFDRSNKPTRFCASTCPSFARRTPIFRRDFLSFQFASTASHNPCAANYRDPLQLLFKFGTMAVKHFVHPLSQVHERFSGHL